jgi:hypothetical protein
MLAGFSLEAILSEIVPFEGVRSIENLLRRRYAKFLDCLGVPAEERRHMIEALYPTTPNPEAPSEQVLPESRRPES